MLSFIQCKCFLYSTKDTFWLWSLGFSAWWLLVAEHGLQVHRLSTFGFWALEYRLSSCGAWPQSLHGMWAGPGIESVSPALAGRFFTTEPPGKPSFIFFITLISTWHIPFFLCVSHCQPEYKLASPPRSGTFVCSFHCCIPSTGNSAWQIGQKPICCQLQNTCKYSQFSLFVQLCCIVSTRTRPLLLGEAQGWVPLSLWSVFLSTDQSITLFYMCSV